MIALNRPLPINCLECPCMWTIAVEEAHCRFCAAAGKEILIVNNNNLLDGPWLNFDKPDWCPWIEKEN